MESTIRMRGLSNENSSVSNLKKSKVYIYISIEKMGK